MIVETATLIVGVATFALEAFNTITSHGNSRSREAAIKKLFLAISATSDYLDKSDRLSGTRDADEERRLDRLWKETAEVILPIDLPLAERLYLKADYWRNPDRWTEQQLVDAHLKLKSVRKAAMSFL
jgi:hypothetical protein